MHKGANDLSGRVFGMLSVEREKGRSGGKLMWLCRCSCGVSKAIRGTHLISGAIVSCGCERKRRALAALTTHGASSTPLYGAWQTMHRRCSDPKSESFHRYGGRGITVCERWASFENFLADVGQPPSRTHSLDRWPDNDGNYEPGNVRWATGKEQARNTRANRLLTHGTKTMCLTEWAEVCGIGMGTLAWRLDRGWPPSKALSHPVRGAKPL